MFSTSLSEPALDVSLWLVKRVVGIGSEPGSSSESRSGESGGSGIPGEAVGPQRDVNGGFDGAGSSGDEGHPGAGLGEAPLARLGSSGRVATF